MQLHSPSRGLGAACVLGVCLLTHCSRPPSETSAAESPRTAELTPPLPPSAPATPATASAPVPSAPPAPTASTAETPATPEAQPDGTQDMLLVPAGRFMMGADNEGEQDERPAHQ